MSEMENKKPEVVAAPKAGFFSKLFGGKSAKSAEDMMKEEQIQSPFRTVMRTFASNKLSMGAFIVFLLIVVTMFIGPLVKPVQLEYNEITQFNLPPGRDMMKMPSEIANGAKEIAVGRAFAIGTDKNDKTYVWGKPDLFAMPDLSVIPKEAEKLVKVAAGYDHVAGITPNKKVVAWGSDRTWTPKNPDKAEKSPNRVPKEIAAINNAKEIYAGYAITMVITEDGKGMLFGNTKTFDWNQKAAENLAKGAFVNDTAAGLTKDGKIVYLGNTKNAYSEIPTSDAKFVDIAGGATTFAAIDEKGKVYVWGQPSYRGEDKVPDLAGKKPVKISNGRYHYVLTMEDGSVVTFGDNTLGQSKLPGSISGIKNVSSGYYQNYAIDNDGKVKTFGLKGYLLGSDEFGRDIFTRILNGGRLTLTIGSVAVIISTIIGMILGGVSGYFGGKVDMLLQRFGEVVNALPFLPTVIILNSVLGNRVNPTQKVYLIMVLLGLLGWTGLMRLVRAQVLSLREQEFVTAARSLGIKEMNIVFQHIIPNTISIILVSATLSFAGSLLTEASLSFLGFGVQPPQPTWGNMLFGANNSTVVKSFWWRWVYASIILSICVICINLIGTGLDDAINPKSQDR